MDKVINEIVCNMIYTRSVSMAKKKSYKSKIYPIRSI